jgi:hypothetical protein
MSRSCPRAPHLPKLSLLPIAAGLFRRNQALIAGDLLAAVKPVWRSNHQLEG